MTQRPEKRGARPLADLEAALDALQAQAEADNLAEFQELIWALLDEQISEQDLARLESVLRNSEPARRIYAQCQRIHADLQVHFRSERGTSPDRARPPIPPIEFPAPSPLPSNELPPR